MPNLTKHQPLKWQVPPKPTDFPIHRHNGIDYRIVPESALSKLLSEKDGLFWISIGMGCTVIAAITHLVVNATTPAAANQPVIIEKPVIVDREKVVPTSCLMFCGK